MTATGDYRLLNAVLLLAAVHFAIAIVALAVRRPTSSLCISFGLLFHAVLFAVVGFAQFHNRSSLSAWLLAAGGLAAVVIVATAALSAGRTRDVVSGETDSVVSHAAVDTGHE